MSQTNEAEFISETPEDIAARVMQDLRIQRFREKATAEAKRTLSGKTVADFPYVSALTNIGANLIENLIAIQESDSSYLDRVRLANGFISEVLHLQRYAPEFMGVLIDGADAEVRESVPELSEELDAISRYRSLAFLRFFSPLPDGTESPDPGEVPEAWR